MGQGEGAGLAQGAGPGHHRTAKRFPVRQRQDDCRLPWLDDGPRRRGHRLQVRRLSEHLPLARQHEIAEELGQGERGVLPVCRRPEQGKGIRAAVTCAGCAQSRRRTMIKGLHHNAYRCRDSEQTRQFYEGFLGLPLSGSLEIRETKTGRKTSVLHTFYRLDDGSYLAFFEVPDMPFEWKAQQDYDLHI